MKFLLLLSGVLMMHAAQAQKDPAVRFSKEITIPALKEKLTILSADDMEGRETGTRGQRKAAAWIEDQFKQIGLEQPATLQGYQQYYPLYKDSLIRADVFINDIAANPKQDFLFNSPNVENGEISASGVVFAGFGIEDSAYNDYAHLNVQGKIVIFLLGEPKVNGHYLISGSNQYSQWTYPGLRVKLKLAEAKGAKAVWVVNPAMDEIEENYFIKARQTTLYYPRPAAYGIPQGVISKGFAKKIFGDSLFTHFPLDALPENVPHLEVNAKVKLLFEKHRDTIFASNVIGMIKGAEKPDEFLMITAHYDHLGIYGGEIYNGADDDGSGSVAVIEMAQAFMEATQKGYRPKRSIVFMTVSGEEKGLWGSEYYSDHPVFPLEKTTADLNIDMIGRIDTERKKADIHNYVYVVGHDKLSSDLPKINEGANKKYSRLTLDYKFDDPNDVNRIYYRSDHYNFARKGVPVLFFYDGMLLADYHKPTDTVEKIEWPLYVKRTKMIFFTAWEMANRNQMLVRDIPLPASAGSR